jgi:uncharacterized protein YegJ (DUF2314 family)
MKRFAALLVLLLVVGCGRGKKPVDTVVMFNDNDADMNAAIQKAKDTVLDEFVPALQNVKPEQTGHAIKYPVSDGKQGEHMWLRPVSFDGKNFSGRIANIPQLVKNVRMGQKVTVAPAQISDWMYVDNGRLVGGFTIRVMRDKMSAQEREEKDKELPFKID